MQRNIHSDAFARAALVVDSARCNPKISPEFRAGARRKTAKILCESSMRASFTPRLYFACLQQAVCLQCAVFARRERKARYCQVSGRKSQSRIKPRASACVWVRSVNCIVRRCLRSVARSILSPLSRGGSTTDVTMGTTLREPYGRGLRGRHARVRTGVRASARHTAGSPSGMPLGSLLAAARPSCGCRTGGQAHPARSSGGGARSVC